MACDGAEQRSRLGICAARTVAYTLRQAPRVHRCEGRCDKRSQLAPDVFGNWAGELTHPTGLGGVVANHA